MRIVTIVGTIATAAAAALVLSQPASAAVAAKKPATHECTAASNGLDVVAISKHPKAKACNLAIRVANQYLKVADQGKPIVVKVDKTTWKCQERKGNPNPYGECVNQQHRAEKVRLFS